MSLHAARERRSQSRAETRRVILDATEALLLEAGHRGLSVRKLVERCGYSAPTIYHIAPPGFARGSGSISRRARACWRSERGPYGRRRILPWGDSGFDRVLNSESVFKIGNLDQRLDCAKYCSVFNDVISLSHR